MRDVILTHFILYKFDEGLFSYFTLINFDSIKVFYTLGMVKQNVQSTNFFFSFFPSSVFAMDGDFLIDDGSIPPSVIKQAEMIRLHGNECYKRNRLGAAIEAYTEVPIPFPLLLDLIILIFACERRCFYELYTCMNRISHRCLHLGSNSIPVSSWFNYLDFPLWIVWIVSPFCFLFLIFSAIFFFCSHQCKSIEFRVFSMGSLENL